MRRAYSYERFSQHRQADGDSLRRQSSLVKTYCDRNGLTLDTSLKLRDKGVSGYTGDNSAGGELAAFLQAIADGKVPTGSVLIIENIDRLTRLPPNEANKILDRILQAGVSLVTTSPEREYTAANISSFGIWIELQVSMLLAHEESKKKSGRLREVWSEKRRTIADRKLTPRAPAWLALSADKRTWTVKEDIANLVRRMFTLAAEGLGQGSIARIMHKEYPPGLKGKGWHTWSIGAILRSRAVLGEFQPHVGRPGMAGRKSTRKPIGEPIPGYFPAIISEAEFYKAKDAIDGRFARACGCQEGETPRREGGRIKGVPNLFSSLLFDARDGKTLVINASDGKRHLVTSGAIRRQPGSAYHSFPYDAFEGAMLALLKELKASDILARNGHEDKVEALSGKLASINHKIAVVRKRADEGDEITTFLDMIADYEREKKAIIAELEKAKAKATSRGAEGLGEAQSMIDLLSKAADAERDGLRLKIRARIRQLVDKAVVLIVKRGRYRLAAVQVWFAEGGMRRDFLIVYHPFPQGSVPVKNGARWEARSLAVVPGTTDLDLRRPEHVAGLEAVLMGMDLAAVDADAPSVEVAAVEAVEVKPARGVKQKARRPASKSKGKSR